MRDRNSSLHVWGVSVSVEPPPKQGCEGNCYLCDASHDAVSVEPPPKQGCEAALLDGVNRGLSLSGTPAEAGVRDFLHGPMNSLQNVSVELPPKQGCEDAVGHAEHEVERSQWNPRRSRGARHLCSRPWMSYIKSQWNPRRSRGARRSEPGVVAPRPSLSGTPAEAGVREDPWFRYGQECAVSVEPPPKQGCEIAWGMLRLASKGLSGTPAEAGVRVFRISYLNVYVNCLSGTPAEAGVRVNLIGDYYER